MTNAPLTLDLLTAMGRQLPAWSHILLLVLFLSCAGPGLDPEPSKTPLTRSQEDAHPSLILLSIDGLMPEHVLQAEQHGLKIPHLRSFLQQGTYSTGVQGILPTLTYPSHVTLLTGVTPLRHGILNNGLMDPLNVHKDAWYWFSEEIQVPTLWDAMKRQGLRTASIDWPVSIGAPVDSLIVQYWRDSTDLDRRHLRALSTPGLLQEMEGRLGPYPAANWSSEGDRQRMKFIIDLIKNKRPHFLTAYLSSVDDTSHHHGPFSPENKAAIEAVDGLIGELLAASEKYLPGTVMVALVSDHGFREVDEEIRLNSALRQHRLLEVDQKNQIRTWKAYSWEGQGVAAIYLNPALTAGEGEIVKSQVQQVLEKLQHHHPQKIDRLYGPKDLLQMGGFPGASFLVTARGGLQFSGSFEGRVFGEKAYYRATHGFLPENQEMDAVFLIKGPGIPAKKKLGRIRMIDIAPTLAHLMGLRLPSAEGKTLLERP